MNRNKLNVAHEKYLLEIIEQDGDIICRDEDTPIYETLRDEKMLIWSDDYETYIILTNGLWWLMGEGHPISHALFIQASAYENSLMWEEIADMKAEFKQVKAERDAYRRKLQEIAICPNEWEMEAQCDRDLGYMAGLQHAADHAKGALKAK